MQKEDKILLQKIYQRNLMKTFLYTDAWLTVSQVNQFREKCFKKDIEYKNSL